MTEVEGLRVQGFFIVDLGLEHKEELLAKARRDAADFETSGPHRLFRPSELVFEGLLGEEGSARIAHLQGPDDDEEIAGEGLRALDKELTDLAVAAGPFFKRALGFDVTSRSGGLLHETGPLEGVIAPLTEGQASCWLETFAFGKVMCIICIGPGSGTLELRPYDDKASEAYKMDLSPGTVVVVRSDCLSVKHLCRTRTLLLSCHLLVPGGNCDVRTLTPCAKRLNDWIGERLQVLKDLETTDKRADIPRHLQLLMNRQCFKGQYMAVRGMSSRASPSLGTDDWFGRSAQGLDGVIQVPLMRWEMDHMYDPDPDCWQWSKTFARHMSMVDGIEMFDNKMFGISVAESKIMDPQQRLSALQRQFMCICMLTSLPISSALIWMGDSSAFLTALFSAGYKKGRIMNSLGGMCARPDKSVKGHWIRLVSPGTEQNALIHDTAFKRLRIGRTCSALVTVEQKAPLVAMSFGRIPRGSQPRQPGKLSKLCIEEMPKVDSHPNPQVSESSEASGPEPLLKKAESSGAELLVKESEASGVELLAKKSAIVTIAPTLAYDLFNMIVEGETITIDTTIAVAMLAITIVKDVSPTMAIELLPVIVEAELQPKIDDGTFRSPVASRRDDLGDRASPPEDRRETAPRRMSKRQIGEIDLHPDKSKREQIDILATALMMSFDLSESDCMAVADIISRCRLHRLSGLAWITDDELNNHVIASDDSLYLRTTVRGIVARLKRESEDKIFEKDQSMSSIIDREAIIGLKESIKAMAASREKKDRTKSDDLKAIIKNWGLKVEIQPPARVLSMISSFWLSHATVGICQFEAVIAHILMFAKMQDRFGLPVAVKHEHRLLDLCHNRLKASEEFDIDALISVPSVEIVTEIQLLGIKPVEEKPKKAPPPPPKGAKAVAAASAVAAKAVAKPGRKQICFNHDPSRAGVCSLGSKCSRDHLDTTLPSRLPGTMLPSRSSRLLAPNRGMIPLSLRNTSGTESINRPPQVPVKRTRASSASSSAPIIFHPEPTASDSSDEFVGPSSCSSTSTSSSRSASPERRDPVLDIIIPSDSASFETVSEAHQSHLKTAKGRSEDIAAPATPGKSIVRCVDRISALGIEGLVTHRRQHLHDLRRMSIELRPESDLLLSAAPEHVRNVLGSAGILGSHPALLKWCLEKIQHPDLDLVEDLLRGFPLIGELPIDPRAIFKKVRQPIFSRGSLWEAGSRQRDRLVRRHCKITTQSAEDALADIEMLAMTMLDAKLKRMSQPRRFDKTRDHFLTRRFAVRQRDAKGRWKLRCIDDFHESLVNDACGVNRRIRMGRHHDLEWVVRHLRLGHKLKLLKSDFKAAYLGCPIRTCDLKFAHILIRGLSNELLVSEQFAMPFGAVGAVYAWDRLGAAITAVLIDMFLVPCSRYVDDLFWAEFEESATECRETVIEVVSLLGFTLEPSKTPAPSDSLDILGVATSLETIDGKLHLTFVPDASKVSFWLEDLRSILSSGVLLLESLARSSVASASPLGPYTFVRHGAGRINQASKLSLAWWIDRLSHLQPRCSIMSNPVDEALAASPVIMARTVEFSIRAASPFLRELSQLAGGRCVSIKITEITHNRATLLAELPESAVGRLI
ncbi:unnamed protein product [Polarella glacialis]|uniref:C3H1-type domain-containing protein n=1 Tax=Polarella glacialis TaxID=89957 RepID=A0A813GAF2_POLGL|nr:unnamed protein product [Polarella glacialis]